MTITNEEFDDLVHQLEQQAASNPVRYKARVFGLALLGYGYVFFVLAMFIAVTAGVVYFLVDGRHWILLKKLALPLIIVVGIMLRAMWVRIGAPTGIQLKRRDCPELFNVLAKIRKHLKGPRFHKVLLSDDFNASVSQVPLMGIFGWQRNYLTLGLPLMQALSPEQFAAVLAHEYGHLSGSHSRFAGWIYRVRQTWQQINHAFEESGHRVQFIFSKFFDWYAPYFWAYSFVLARADEYEADHCSALVVGKRNAADALINVHLKGAVVEEEFWPAVYKRAGKEAEPVSRAFHDLAVILHKPGKPKQVAHWLKVSLEQTTGTEDTHPSLSDRLKGLGKEARILPQSQGNAALAFLGANYANLTTQISQQWHEGVKESWKERHESVQHSLSKLQELEARLDELNADETVDYALLIEEFRPEQDPLPFAKAAYDKDNNDIGANYVLGRFLIERDDNSGIPYVEKAMTAEGEYIKSGCRLIYNYYIEKDKEEQAQPYYDRFYKMVEQEMAQQEERENLLEDDKFISHGLPQEDVQAVIDQLKPYKRIGKAWLTRKQLLLPKEPLYVLGFKLAWFYWADDGAAEKFQKKLSDIIEFPGECFVIGYTSDNKKLFKKLKAVADSQIYPV